MLVRTVADCMILWGERVTADAIRAFLFSRGFMLTAEQIGRNLREHRESNPEKIKPYTNGRRVRIDGEVFDSIRKAAAAKELANDTVRKRVANPDFPSWRYADAGPIRSEVKRGRWVSVGKETYLSVVRAAEAEGVTPDTVRNRIKSASRKFRDWSYADAPKFEERLTKFGRRVLVGEEVYMSIAMAAEAESVTTDTVRNRVRSDSPKFRHWKYLPAKSPGWSIVASPTRRRT